jgi:undecaprenyl-diphosphatase
MQFLLSLPKSAPLEAFGYFLAEILPYLLAIAAVVAVWTLSLRKLRKFAIAQSLLTVLLARGIIVSAIYMFYSRPRPFIQLEFRPLLEPIGQSSFPSGHAAAFAALAFSLWPYSRPASVLLFSGAVLNGVGRMYAGVHWLSDVVAGLIIGAVAALFIELLVRPIRKSINM